MSQIFDDILATETLRNSREKFLNRDISLASSFSGTVYPTSPYVGMTCFRTDYAKLFVCRQITPSQIWEEIGTGSRFAAATGTANALVVDFTPDLTLTDGLEILVRALYANSTTTPTIAIDGGTPKSIVKKGGAALEVNDITAAGYILQLVYDLTNDRWELLNPAGAFGDVSSDTSSSVDSEIALYDGTSGKKIKRCTLSGMAKMTSGVVSAATAGTDYAKPDTKSSWTKQQSGAQYSLSSSSNHIATDCDLGNNFYHELTEDTTLDNPTNIVAGTYYTWTFKQHASAAKTLALGAYFVQTNGDAFGGVATTANTINTIVAFAPTTTKIFYNIITGGVA